MNRIFNHRNGVFLLIIGMTIAGLAGTDLVLPAIPFLPDALHGSVSQAQWVIAAFIAGTASGLLIFGYLGSLTDARWLIVVSLLLYALFSLLATFAGSLTSLIVLRFIQGLVAAAPAVFAPGMIRRLFDENHAVKALGLMGSVESLTPAIAPIVGAWLLHHFGWPAAFFSVALLTFALFCLALLNWRHFPALPPAAANTGYWPLIKNRRFLRYALSQAFTLGGLLIFVFAAPVVITLTMQGNINDFVIMQSLGIVFFILCATQSNKLVQRFGSELIIFTGSWISALGLGAICLYALSGFVRVEGLWLLFILVNAGLGLRGPPGFYQALMASEGNDARAAALVILFILLSASLATALIAPFIHWGLLFVSLVAALISLCSVLTLKILK